MVPQVPETDATARTVKPGRAEQLAMEDIGSTQVTAHTSIAVSAIFLSFIAMVMFFDLKALFKNDPTTGELIAEKSIQPANRTVMPDWWHNISSKNRHVMNHIRQFEANLEDTSTFGRLARPPVQNTLAPLRESSGEVMIGKDGWLFYRPSLRFLTQAQTSKEVQSAPIDNDNTNGGSRGLDASANVISQFAKDLEKRGIRLVIVPVWPKMSVHPEHFGATANKRDILKPHGYDTWLRRVKSSGALVFDPAPSIQKSSRSSGAAYLKTDTHWNPAAMKNCAEDLAAYLIQKNLIQTCELKPQFVPRTVSNKGDLARMMDLPSNSPHFAKEDVKLLEVREDSGNRWIPKKDSSVLLLGDSFSNIYSLLGMGWGEDAGFSEHLGAALGMRIDTILRNSDGASATRAILSRELSRGKDRLQGKQVVVWEFAASQLTEGEWHPYPCDTIAQNATEASYLEIKDQQPMRITGTIAEMGDIPHPQSTVYADFVGYMIMEDLIADRGDSVVGKKALAYGLVMKNKVPTGLADLRPGQTISFTLHAWTYAENEFGRLQRSEPDGEAALQPMNWITEIELKNSDNELQSQP